MCVTFFDGIMKWEMHFAEEREKNVQFLIVLSDTTEGDPGSFLSSK